MPQRVLCLILVPMKLNMGVFGVEDTNMLVKEYRISVFCFFDDSSCNNTISERLIRVFAFLMSKTQNRDVRIVSLYSNNLLFILNRND